MNSRYLILAPALLLFAALLITKGRLDDSTPPKLLYRPHVHHPGCEHDRGDGTYDPVSSETPTKTGDRNAEQKSPFTTTDSGLQYQFLFRGTGPTPKPGDKVSVQYEGRLETGFVIDSNIDKDPTTLPVNSVIKGWQEALQLTPTGSRIRLIIPYELAYGEKGRPPLIPPKSNLLFEIELIDTIPANYVPPELPSDVGTAGGLGPNVSSCTD